MTGRKKWFIKINQSMKNKVKFADDSILVTKGIGDVSIRRMNGKKSLMSHVLYIPGIKCNILSIGQMLEKNYKIHMEYKVLRFIDSRGNLIMKALMSKIGTFNIELNVIEHGCLATTTSREEWIWHYRLGHLNFRYLNSMQINGMVSGLPKIHIPSEVCGEYVQDK